MAAASHLNLIATSSDQRRAFDIPPAPYRLVWLVLARNLGCCASRNRAFRRYLFGSGQVALVPEQAVLRVVEGGAVVCGPDGYW